MKILIIGTGSIGIRHLNNIVALGYSDLVIVSRSRTEYRISESGNIPVYNSIESAVAERNFDTAIICSPTAYHLTDLNILLQFNITNIYLEKPISHDFLGITAIAKTIADNNVNIALGYDLHFDPGIQKVKELLDSASIGKTISVNAQVGQYLPDWRPNQNYKNGMSAKIASGGGVLLDLIHEFDYLYWLIGPVETIASFCNNSGALEIETEDIAEVLIKFSNGTLGTIHLDYLQQKPVRNCLITGTKGSIFWNLMDQTVTWVDNQKKETSFVFKEFERNERFKAIMKAFLEKQTDYRLTNFEEGMKSLTMVLAAKHSNDKKIFVQLNQYNP